MSIYFVVFAIGFGVFVLCLSGALWIEHLERRTRRNPWPTPPKRARFLLWPLRGRAK